MANSSEKITNLSELTTVASGDILHILDVSDSNNNKRITVTNLLSEVTTFESLSDVTLTSIATNELIQWNGSTWINQTIAEIGLLKNVVEDTTPELGGNLDALTKNITNIGLLQFGTGESINMENNDMIFDVTTGDFFSLDVNGTPEYTFDATSFTMSEANNIVFGTTTGTKIGTGTTQKIGFWDATPVVQQSHIADPSADSASLKVAVDLILAQMATTGMQAAS